MFLDTTVSAPGKKNLVLDDFKFLLNKFLKRTKQNCDTEVNKTFRGENYAFFKVLDGFVAFPCKSILQCIAKYTQKKIVAKQTVSKLLNISSSY